MSYCMVPTVKLSFNSSKCSFMHVACLNISSRSQTHNWMLHSTSTKQQEYKTQNQSKPPDTAPYHSIIALCLRSPWQQQSQTIMVHIQQTLFLVSAVVPPVQHMSHVHFSSTAQPRRSLSRIFPIIVLRKVCFLASVSWYFSDLQSAPYVHAAEALARSDRVMVCKLKTLLRIRQSPSVIMHVISQELAT